jgi:transglutaminase-like putative cysteine protease
VIGWSRKIANRYVMQEYLKSTDVIDWQHPAVFALSQQLTGDSIEATVRRCFDWVRDEIRHSGDFQLNPITCRASEVLKARTGFCYAKSHLLAALLRANNIAAGLCYQRLSIDDAGTQFCLHGLNAVYLPAIGWYRLDPRGNKPSVNAQFTPPIEQLAFTPTLPGETDLPGIHPNPIPEVLTALRTYTTVSSLSLNLPTVISLK